MTTLQLRKSASRACKTPNPISAGQPASAGLVRAPKMFVLKNASKKLLLLSLIATFVAAQALAQQIKPDETKRIELNQAYGKLPLSFEANQGQTDSRVKFLSRGNGYSLFLTPTETVLVLKKTARDNNAHPGALPSQAINDQHKTSQSSLAATVLRMKLVGGNATTKIAATGELPGKSNYLIGNDSNKWRTNVSNYTKVVYRDVYPGVDLIYYGNQRQLEHDFVIAPGADPKAIRLGFQGAKKISLNSAGDLVLDTKEGEVQLKQLRVYQKVNGEEQKIAARYVLKGKRRIAFEVAEYDRHQPLVIDPVLSYSTYLGGSSDDFGHSIAVDASGNAYVAGEANSANFPITSGAFQTTFGGGAGDGFVTKLNPTGSALVYSTYLGGTSFDTVDSIAVDASGNVYVSGLTASTNFPTTPGAFQTTNGGGQDGFVTKLNSTGTALVYSTYLGGNSNDRAEGIALDASGNAYVTGFAQSTNFPTTPGAFQTTQVGVYNAFVTKLNSTGTALIYSTYLGGNSQDIGFGIAVDASGNAYVMGVTNSSNFPTTLGAFQTTNAGGYDAFVTKLNPTGSALVYSTYLGGNSDDDPAASAAFAVDAFGNTYLTGATFSPNFPTTAGAFQTTFNGARTDGFVTKLNPTGSALVYSTYLGGSAECSGSGMAVDASGNAWIVGGTSATNDFPTTPDAFQPTFGGGSGDGFVTELNRTGSALIYSTYLGGNSIDSPIAVALDASGNAYVTGQITSTNFPTTSGAFQTTNGGGYDAFVAKFGNAPIPTPTPTPTPFPGGGNFVIGDRNAVVGNHVTFWGAQWANQNSLSGGSAPESFKGFAHSTSANPPACGGSWTSGSGNSSEPPGVIGPSITVIVASSITKSGSTIAGNSPELVIVKTDPGYAPNPGHAGTGTVTSVICH